MPTYSVACTSCKKSGSVRMSFQEYDSVKQGNVLLCPQTGCGGEASIVFNPGEVSFVLKDGESGGWVSKAGKENAYRTARRKVMAQRERDHVFKSRLQPNFNGQLTHNWTDARDAAYDSTYDKVRGEHGAGMAQQAAKESAATYESHVKSEGT